ncbi:hypothetical protein PCANC_11592 [Puccinia coronata f. sp. avenae]|uniref:Uncharacterized protein n=1 Tax=Puccinia coronata f. sp. avenae TaxID=200324 RepID=A0A2N5SCC2_9BASI|nr:hypothetical protein PCASD_18297 [Puccinia coronata f. sp. avenae]PLW46073.1 hypothetical protein PCANC_11592 [Puccinia coronata f. sp. avenae]
MLRRFLAVPRHVRVVIDGACCVGRLPLDRGEPRYSALAYYHNFTDAVRVLTVGPTQTTIPLSCCLEHSLRKLLLHLQEEDRQRSGKPQFTGDGNTTMLDKHTTDYVLQENKFLLLERAGLV